jgi:hypothetical protein
MAHILGKRPNLLFLIAIRRLPQVKWEVRRIPNRRNFSRMSDCYWEQVFAGPDLFYVLCMITQLHRHIYYRKMLGIMVNLPKAPMNDALLPHHFIRYPKN